VAAVALQVALQQVAAPSPVVWQVALQRVVAQLAAVHQEQQAALAEILQLLIAMLSVSLAAVITEL